LQKNSVEIHQQGVRADDVIQSMLMHSRSQGNQKQLTDINSLLAQSLHWVERSFQFKDRSKSCPISFSTQYDESIGEIVLNPQEISRAFINMLDNACHAVVGKYQQAEPGTYTPEVSLYTLDRGETIEISIRDNGIGISPQNLGKIFDPFFTTKTPQEGTGLGLSLTREILVDKHQGNLEVNAEFGVYSEFVASLPKNLASDFPRDRSG